MPQSKKPRSEGFPNHDSKNSEWTSWISPTPRFMTKCCDCGLVHEFEFKLAVSSQGEEVTFYQESPVRIIFRARRRRGKQIAEAFKRIKKLFKEEIRK